MARTTASKTRSGQKTRPAAGAADDGAWHLDKRVPIALIVTLLLQGAAAIWWASGLSYDVRQLQRDFDEIKIEAKERNAKIDEISTLRADVRNFGSAIERLERAVDRLVQFGQGSPKRATN